MNLKEELARDIRNVPTHFNHSNGLMSIKLEPTLLADHLISKGWGKVDDWEKLHKELNESHEELYYKYDKLRSKQPTMSEEEIADIVEPILDKWFPNDGQRFEAEEIAKALCNRIKKGD